MAECRQLQLAKINSRYDGGLLTAGKLDVGYFLSHTMNSYKKSTIKKKQAFINEQLFAFLLDLTAFNGYLILNVALPLRKPSI
jgi:hypothetical protein